MRIQRFLTTSIGLAGLLFGGCGKPLTLQDCERIVARITELELKAAAVSDQTEVESQVAQTKDTFKEQALTDCVGRRLPKSALRCVEEATTARQIIDECFD